MPVILLDIVKKCKKSEIVEQLNFKKMTALC